jgi:hypothetical protein
VKGRSLRGLRFMSRFLRVGGDGRLFDQAIVNCPMQIWLMQLWKGKNTY